MRKVYFAEPDLNGRCLGKPNQLRQIGLVETTAAKEADVIAAMHLDAFTPDLLAIDRLNIVWTPEPAHSLERVPFVVRGEQKVHIFNLFNTNVVTDNFYFVQDRETWPHLGPNAPEVDLRPIATEADCNVAFGSKRAVAMMARKSFSCVFDGVEHSLCDTRNRFALEAHADGWLDIYGKKWPPGVALGVSRKEPDWRAIKIATFKDYNFVVCPENCVADYYLTEKVWDAIRANCLPIYAGADTAYDSFPADSFVDLRAFDSAGDAFRFIEAMPFDEYRRRLNVLKEVYRTALATDARWRSRNRTMRIISAFLTACFGDAAAAETDAGSHPAAAQALAG